MKYLPNDEFIQFIRHKQLISDPDNPYSFFFEGDVTFKPTYRLIMNTIDYDYKRNPAWTDRIVLFFNKKYAMSNKYNNYIQNNTI